MISRVENGKVEYLAGINTYHITIISFDNKDGDNICQLRGYD